MEFPHDFHEIEFNKDGSVVRGPEQKQKNPKKTAEKKSDEDSETKGLRAEVAFLEKNESDMGWRDRERLEALRDRLKKLEEGGTDTLVI